jgi:lysophospholipase L1-like esterase
MSVICRTLPRVAAAIALALTLAGVGCSGGTSLVEQTDPEGLNDHSVVVALGDSITFGVLDTNVPECLEMYRGWGGFCPPLEGFLGKTVVNAGICGEDSNGGRDRVTKILKRFRPGVILLDYSPNDLFDGPHHDVINLRLMVDAALANHTVPVVGTLIPATSYHSGWEPFAEAVNALILEMCAEKGLICADLHAAFVNDPRFQESPFNLLSEDGLHPNHAGYELMAETWAAAVKQAY